ncbi:LysE family translocator [Nonomuraea sp. NPDC050404]|uniref:LysE family translocator n=1 Tax=Nonomuraea sp. NPDC050404 TaxID=3155783 RepID=UPI0033D44FAF
MTWENLTAYIGVVLLASISPGPDVALVLRNSVRHGWAAGCRTGLGIAAGLLMWGLISAVGITAVLAASPVAFLVLKVLGAAYLCYLGARLIWYAVRPRPAQPLDPGVAPPAERGLFAQGFLTNLVNPKVAAFFVALLPQFITVRGVEAAPVVLGMASINAVAAVAVMSVYAVLGGQATRLVGNQRFERGLDSVVGAVLVVLAGRLLFTELP